MFKKNNRSNIRTEQVGSPFKVTEAKREGRWASIRWTGQGSRRSKPFTIATRWTRSKRVSVRVQNMGLSGRKSKPVRA